MWGNEWTAAAARRREQIDHTRPTVPDGPPGPAPRRTWRSWLSAVVRRNRR